MLQASEYYINDYLEWLFRVKDFNKIIKTGKLEYTVKSVTVFISIYLLYLMAILTVILIFLTYFDTYSYLPLLALIIVPYMLAYLSIIPVIILKYLFQKPYEIIIAQKLKQKVGNHKAIKIAISGSYGKTTMREILRTVISAEKKVAAPGGSINTLLGINGFVKSLDGDEDVVIFELGEHYPGDIRKLCEIIRPDIGVITGINEAHLQRFKSIENTVATIYEISEFLEDMPLYINGDDGLVMSRSNKAFTTFNTAGCNLVEVNSASSNLEGTVINFSFNDETIKVKSKLLGLHLVGVLSAAADIALLIGMKSENIKKGLEQTEPFPRRLERKDLPSGVIVLDDSYNGNPTGVKAVLDFLEDIKGHKIFYVTSGLVEMGEKSKEVHYKIAKQIVGAKIDTVILVKTSGAELIGDGLKEYNFKGRVLWYDNTQDAYAALPQITVSGDVVLLQTDWPDQYI
jgi:UDP-N-acetylmuramoyl-tripeptide--D-alanyl-D-alanine ligase